MSGDGPSHLAGALTPPTSGASLPSMEGRKLIWTADCSGLSSSKRGHAVPTVQTRKLSRLHSQEASELAFRPTSLLPALGLLWAHLGPSLPSREVTGAAWISLAPGGGSWGLAPASVPENARLQHGPLVPTRREEGAGVCFPQVPQLSTLRAQEHRCGR